MEMRCFRNLLGVSYKDNISNEQIRTMIRQEIGHYDDLLATVKKRKLEWYGHVTRSKGLAPPEEGEKEEDSESDGMTISESGQA